MDMVIVIPTMAPGDLPEPATTVLATAGKTNFFVVRNTPKRNRGVIGSYELAYRETNADILAYIHDDVSIYEVNWPRRVLLEFEDPTVGLVGFGGAVAHGSPDLYKRPYQIQQLGRGGYMSNVDDAEVHGTRYGGEADVVVLDGFSLIVRRELLDKAGGWPVDRYPPHHVYDYWLCAMARRHGYRIRYVGIRCHHHGGGTAVSSDYQAWAKQTPWGSDAEMHRRGHELFYEDFRDVMPARVEVSHGR